MRTWTGQGPSAALDTHKRLTGPGASSRKYDIITALLVTTARGNADVGRLAMRLSLLITARFNWRQESFAVAQKEMARMWGVTERTAKREIAAMRARGWIAVSVPAARGRVAQHRIDFDAVLRETMPHWDAVGPDFAARMTGRPEAPEVPDNVVPFAASAVPAPGSGTPWGATCEKLRAQDPAVFDAWFARLVPVEDEAPVLTLQAPSRFVADYVRTHFRTRLLAAALSAEPGLRDVEVIWTEE
ncbi:DnaA N-terminal domain-containing protein [Pseudooceanicola aestuarii]|uniref:DnaA N-terminal domain-containing protein n=1 Tax=Pseudooceanicola aestuarii TaxID=2697319 RepID=UPI0013D2D843|nr:DnaA N-terminal domain-containing protein [Pseudooceanicola aestuarii]